MTDATATAEKIADDVKSAAKDATDSATGEKSFFEQAQEAVTAAIESTITAAKDNPAAAAAIAAGAAAAVAGAAFGVSKLFSDDCTPAKSAPKKK